MATPEQVDGWFRSFGFNPSPREPMPARLEINRNIWAMGALEVAAECGIALDEAHRRLALAFPELYR